VYRRARNARGRRALGSLSANYADPPAWPQPISEVFYMGSSILSNRLLIRIINTASLKGPVRGWASTVRIPGRLKVGFVAKLIAESHREKPA
jgi:hypothetical protein